MTTGKYNKPGLPNAVGDLPNIASFGADYSGGVLSKAYVSPRNNETGNIVSANYSNILIDLSRGSLEYGASTTVMPESADMPVCLYLGCLSKV